MHRDSAAVVSARQSTEFRCLERMTISLLKDIRLVSNFRILQPSNPDLITVEQR